MAKKNIVLGVTGGIAVYKALDLVNALKKLNFDVTVIMTENAQKFVTPLSFETLSNNKVITDMWENKTTWEVEHISIAQKADVIIVAPATANILGKVAHGIADDMLSTVIMASSAYVLFAPAMNTSMYNNPIVQSNIDTLMSFGYDFVEPDKGRLACGDIGVGKLASIDRIIKEIMGYFKSLEQAEKEEEELRYKERGFVELS